MLCFTVHTRRERIQTFPYVEKDFLGPPFLLEPFKMFERHIPTRSSGAGCISLFIILTWTFWVKGYGFGA